jgi:hypothetical protein
VCSRCAQEETAAAAVAAPASSRKRAFEAPAAVAAPVASASRAAPRLTVPKSPQLSTAARRRADAAAAAEAAAASAAALADAAAAAAAARDEVAQALKRRRCASAAAAATSAQPRGLTRPEPFALRTELRAEASAVAAPRTRSRAAGGGDDDVAAATSSPYVPLAERLLRMEARTPPRFKVPFAPFAAGAAPPRLTKAVSPPLATSARGQRGAGTAKSSAELEAEYLASCPRFRARDVDAAMLAPRGVAATPRRSLGGAGGAHLASTPSAAFRRDSFNAAANAGAWTPRRTVAVSPPLATARRCARDAAALAEAALAADAAAMQQRSAFKARPAPRADAPAWAPAPRGRADAAEVDVVPFALSTETRGAAYMRALALRVAQQEEAAAAARDVKARPPPPGAALRAQPSAATLAGASVSLLPGDAFHAAAVAALAKRREAAAAAAAAAARGVRAAPVPRSHVVPFAVERSGSALTETDDVALASDARAERRARYDAAAAQRAQAAEAAQKAKDAAQAAKEAAEVAAMRRAAVHKARPAPSFEPTPLRAAAKRALTEPESPKLATKRRCAPRA